MIEAENSVHIDKPPADVFAFVSDPANEPKWHSDVLQVRRITEGPTRVGSTFGWLFNFMGKREGVMEVVELEPNKLEKILARSGPMGFKPTITYTFESDGTGTRFARRVQMQPQGASRLMAPMMRSMVPKRNAVFVANLKKALEG